MEQVNEQFRVTDLESAGWVFRKLKEKKEEKQKLIDFAVSEKVRIDEWLINETKPIDDSMEYFEGLIKAYYIEQRMENPKAKLSTPWGKVSSRKSQAKWEYDDEQAIGWCRDNGFTKLETKESIKKAELKKYLEVAEEGHVYDPETGEVVEGIRVTEQADSIKVELEG